MWLSNEKTKLQNRIRAPPYRVHKFSNWTTTMNSEQYRTRRIRVFNWPTSVLRLFIVYCEMRGGEGWPMDLSQRHSFEIGIRLFFYSQFSNSTNGKNLVIIVFLYSSHTRTKISSNPTFPTNVIKKVIAISESAHNVCIKSEFKTILACMRVCALARACVCV